jgi:hypothetical protein
MTTDIIRQITLTGCRRSYLDQPNSRASGRSQNERLWSGRFWRKAAIPNIGCVRCGTRYEIEMISRF